MTWECWEQYGAFNSVLDQYLQIEFTHYTTVHTFTDCACNDCIVFYNTGKKISSSSQMSYQYIPFHPQMDFLWKTMVSGTSKSQFIRGEMTWIYKQLLTSKLSWKSIVMQLLSISSSIVLGIYHRDIWTAILQEVIDNTYKAWCLPDNRTVRHSAI